MIKDDGRTLGLNPSPETFIMAALAKIASMKELLDTVKTAPDSLLKRLDQLRPDLEIVSTPGRGGGGGGNRQFGSSSGTGWRSGSSQQQQQQQQQGQRFGFDNHKPSPLPGGLMVPPRPNPGRYQSKFTTGGNLEDKILNTIIGNKLNAFTPLTYNDTRDFIYQIMDSGETEFIRDFVEKVFKKATQEEVYCALFAKLIAEIAHRYPVMYEEMRKYHSEFLAVFDTVDLTETDYAVVLRQKQHRMGYGQFLSELACLNTLDKDDLLAMVERCMGQIITLAAKEEKGKTVEEYVDCLVRLTKALREKSRVFFGKVRPDLALRCVPQSEQFIKRTAAPAAAISVTPKARFGLMDLTDCLASQ